MKYIDSHRPGSTWLKRLPSQLEPYHEAAGVCLCQFYLAIFHQLKLKSCD